MTTLLERAEQMARAAHAGQRDLTGEYSLHLERVAALVEGDRAKTVAWLHDILEDTPTTAEDLQAAGFDAETIADVVILTHAVRPYVYTEYIDLVIANGSKTALAVKVADVLDHLRPLPVNVLSRRKRSDYEAALVKLTRQQ